MHGFVSLLMYADIFICLHICTVFFFFKNCTLSCLDLFPYFPEHREVIFHSALYVQTLFPCLKKKQSSF